MENERLFKITENFRVLLREVNTKTYIAFELSGQTLVIPADVWEKLKPFLYEVDKEFIERRDFKEEKYKTFNVLDDLTVSVGDNKTDTHVIIESADQSIKFNVGRWLKFKEIFSTINAEFEKRFCTMDSDPNDVNDPRDAKL